MHGFSTPKLISTSVGQVKDRVITSREVQISQGIEQILYPDAKEKKKFKLISDTDSVAFGKQVTSILLEWVVYLEAKNVQVAALGNGEVDKAYSDVIKALNQQPTWKALKVGRKEIEAALERKIQAKKFIRFRADSSIVPIGDAEAERYFQQNRTKFGDAPFVKFKTEIKSHLAKQQVERRLKDWFEVLQAKYRVRNFLAEI